MQTQKFITEVNTLKTFYELYCNDKHQNQISRHISLQYDLENIDFDFHLCDECTSLLEYSIQRLQECPHDPKPRCRKCPNPCYDKPQWKQNAKLMRYSGIKLGLIKLKKIFTK